jgi:hypothetical protein
MENQFNLIDLLETQKVKVKAHVIIILGTGSTLS